MLRIEFFLSFNIINLLIGEKNMFEDIKKNKIKSWFIVLLFLAFIAVIVYYICMALDLGELSIIIAIIFAIVSTWGSYYYSDKIVLKLNNDKDKNKIMNISKKLGIDTILEKYPYECSGGQQQLSAIARALVVSPKIIFADEPTGNLDIKNTKRVMEILSKISEFSTVIIVTHDVNVAAYTKKVIYIEDGRIQDVLYKKSLSNSLFRKDIFNYIMNKRQ